MCDFTPSTSYDHKRNHTSSHACHVPGGDRWAEFQHQPLPRVRAPAPEAREEEGQQVYGTPWWGLKTHHVFVSSLSGGLPPTQVLIVTWGFCVGNVTGSVPTDPVGQFRGPRRRLVQVSVQSLLPVPPFASSLPTLCWTRSLVLVPNLGSLQRSFSTGDPAPQRAACGFVGRQAGSRLGFGPISLPEMLKKGWDAAACP